MKMTIEIPEDVLAEVMLLTGKKTKRDAVEFALRDVAHRAQRHRVWTTLFDGITPEQLAADAAPKPSDLIDPPDIDEEAVQRALAADARRRAFRQRLAQIEPTLNEDAESFGPPLP